MVNIILNNICHLNIIKLLARGVSVLFFILFLFWLQYSPYKKGSKLTKARRAKALGLEVAASALMETPHTLDLKQWVKPDVEGKA